MGYILTVFLIGLLILIHEAGHLIGARLAGIKIEKFSIGFGPRLFSFKRNETEYRLSLIPVGGYVMPAVQDTDEFSKYPLSSRIVFSLAGPLANILCAVIIFASIKLTSSDLTLSSILFVPITETVRIAGLIVVSIPDLFEHPDRLSGVIGIVSHGAKTFSHNATRLASLGALLSINLAIFNLIPIPPLDGGKIFFALLEKVFKPIRRLELPVAVTGWVVLFGLMAYASILDIRNLI